MDAETIRKIATSDLKRCIQLMTEEIKRRDKHNKEDIDKRWFEWHLEKTRALAKAEGMTFEDSMFSQAWTDLIELAPEYRGTVCWHLIKTRVVSLQKKESAMKEQSIVTADLAEETLQKANMAVETLQKTDLTEESLKKQESANVLQLFK